MNALTDTPLLVVRELPVSFATRRGTVQAVRGVDLDFDPGEVLGVVGESGSGKSAMVKTIMGVSRGYTGVSIRGSIMLRGRELVGLPASELKRVQGEQISMIFQDPMSSLDPLMQRRPAGRRDASCPRRHG